MSIDLEKEFQKLMDEIVKSIAEKKKNGELSHEEALDLVDLVSERRHPPRRAWNSSGCSFDDDYDSSDDRGWSRSSWCGDNG